MGVSFTSPPRGQRLGALAATFVAAVAIAGCTPVPQGSGSTIPTADQGAVQGVSGGPGVTDYLSYVGGKPQPANPSSSPIAIGWVNSQGGTEDFPEATQGAQAAVDYVNKELGGIDGHPLALHPCFIAQAEEEGQRCGQQLLNDQSVSMIDYGAVVTGNQSLESVVNGAKPIMVTVAANPADSTAKDTDVLYGDQTHVLGAWGTYARDALKAKTAAIVYPSQAGSNSAAAATKQGMTDAGLQVKSVGYDPQATDLLGPLTAAGGQNADVLVPMTDATGCVNLAKALQQIGSNKPVVSNPLCLSPQVQQGLGDFPVGWTFGLAQTLALDRSAPDAVAFTQTATKYGLPQASVGNPYSALGWASVLISAKLMNSVGADKVTPDAMSAALKNFKGPLPMGAPTVSCGKYPDAPAVCNDQTKFYVYRGKGTFQAVSGWIGPPK